MSYLLMTHRRIAVFMEAGTSAGLTSKPNMLSELIITHHIKVRESKEARWEAPF